MTSPIEQVSIKDSEPPEHYATVLDGAVKYFFKGYSPRVIAVDAYRAEGNKGDRVRIFALVEKDEGCYSQLTLVGNRQYLFLKARAAENGLASAWKFDREYPLAVSSERDALKEYHKAQENYIYREKVAETNPQRFASLSTVLMAHAGAIPRDAAAYDPFPLVDAGGVSPFDAPPEPAPVPVESWAGDW